MGLIGGYIHREESPFFPAPMKLPFGLRPQALPPFPLQAWPPEGRCVRDVTEPGALRMQTGDPVTIIEGR